VSESPLRVEPKTLIEGVVRALQEQVLPHLPARTARGQLWAAIDVLRNLAGRIEPARAAFEDEARSAEAALASLASSARAAEAAPLAAEIEARLAAAPATPPAARVVALRALLRDVFDRLDALPPERGDALRAPLGGHLAGQAIRDLSRLQGSLLEEISQAREGGGQRGEDERSRQTG
jgi:hypothetical protein